MANVNNNNITNRLMNMIKSSVSSGVPNQISNVIAPVLNVEPEKRILVVSGTKTTTGTLTINTFSSTKNTYIVGACLSLAKNAACDTSTGSIDLTLRTFEGIQENIIRIPVLTLTASRDSIFVQFENPILIRQGTAMTVTGTFAAGSMVRSAVVQYFEEDAF